MPSYVHESLPQCEIILVFCFVEMKSMIVSKQQIMLAIITEKYWKFCSIILKHECEKYSLPS